MNPNDHFLLIDYLDVTYSVHHGAQIITVIMVLILILFNEETMISTMVWYAVGRVYRKSQFSSQIVKNRR